MAFRYRGLRISARAALKNNEKQSGFAPGHVRLVSYNCLMAHSITENDTSEPRERESERASVMSVRVLWISRKKRVRSSSTERSIAEHSNLNRYLEVKRKNIYESTQSVRFANLKLINFHQSHQLYSAT